MCVGYPGRVLSVDGDMALVEMERRHRTATTLLAPETSPGDWVVVAGGAVLCVLGADEAAVMRHLLDEATRAEATALGDDPLEATPDA
ncbi:MAG TPA: HypC/HybG/HupF family hydrogenase formation chaperone [Candidatus Limnocylindrales bacterium]|nr:HypC/HybG/HupF family hydrogenase formation chaperone [Candidatus Limnocylindrales bacterium]